MTAIATLIRATLEAAAALLKRNPSADEAGIGDRCIAEVYDENGNLKQRIETK